MHLRSLPHIYQFPLIKVVYVWCSHLEQIHLSFLQYKKTPVVTENMDENLIITYSPKYKAYQRKIRSRQIERACISADLFIRTNQGWWYDWCILWKYIATRKKKTPRKNVRFKNGLGGNRTRVQKPIHMRLSHYSQSSFIPSTVLRLTGSQFQ